IFKHVADHFEVPRTCQVPELCQRRQTLTGIVPLWLTWIIPLWPPLEQTDGKSVHRALDSLPAAVQNMGVNHSCAHVAVPEQFLHGPDVVPILQQMSCKRMPKRVRPGWLHDADFQSRIFDGLLEDRFMEVIAASFSRYGVGVMAGCREQPLPSPLFAGIGILALQRIRQGHATEPLVAIPLGLALPGLQMLE